MKKVLSVFLCLVMICTAFSVSVTAEAAAVAKVTSLKVTEVGKKSASIKWKKVNNCSGYYVFYSTKKNKGFKKAKVINNNAVTTATVNKLKAKKTYYFKVRAFYGNQKGKFSATVKAKVGVNIPSKPKSVKSTKVTNNSVSLSWSKVKCKGYIVEYESNNESWKTVNSAINSNNIFIAGLSSNTYYSFRVKAYNKKGKIKYCSNWSYITLRTKSGSSSSGSLPSAPGKVSDLKATDITKYSLTLKWKAVSCTGYEVAYSLDGTKWTTIKKAMTDTKLPISGLTSNTKYFFRVRAFNSNSAGRSASSWAVTNATTKADESITRNIKITVKLPMDSNEVDTLRIYVDDMKNPVKEVQVKCNGTTFTWTTDNKYKGSVKVKAVLVSHKTSNTVSIDKDSCVVDISGIGIDQEVDDKDL